MTVLARTLALAGLLALLPTAAHAGDNDFRLNGVRNNEGILFSQDGGTFSPNNDKFRAFATELGYVLAPRLASPAETLGHSGFHVGVMWSGSLVSDSDYWLITERGQRTGETASMLHTLQLDIRKGLPFSFELGVNFMWLTESHIFAPGLEVRWALQEGYKYIPDFGLRGSVNHMLGNRDMLLTTVGLDAVLSKNFGLGGVVNLAPYASWSFLLIAATSRVIDPTPTVEPVDTLDGMPVQRADVQNNFVFENIPATSRLHHKLTVGLRTIWYVLNVSVQGEFQLLGEEQVVTITTKLGLDF